jgi:hypothetical protein
MSKFYYPWVSYIKIVWLFANEGHQDFDKASLYVVGLEIVKKFP